MKRNSVLMGLLFVCCLFFWFGKTEQVQAAANWTSIDAESSTNGGIARGEELRTVGGTTFSMVMRGGFFRPTTKTLYAYKNKKWVLIASSDGVKSDLGQQIVTDGKTLYYTKKVYTKSLSGQQVPKRIKVYRVTIGKKAKEICSMKAYRGERELFFHMLGIYGGKIFYLEGLDGFYSYSIKSGKHQELGSIRLNTDRVRQYKNYIYLHSDLGSGLTDKAVYILNAKTGKFTKLSDGVMREYKRTPTGECSRANYDIISGKVYYLEPIDGEKRYNPYGGYYSYVSVKKCNPNGSGKRTLIKKLAVSKTKMVVFKKNSITYYNANGKKRTKKF